MIQLTVNGAEQSFGGEPEMPLLWYLRDILIQSGPKCRVGTRAAAFPARRQRIARLHSPLVGSFSYLTTNAYGDRAHRTRSISPRNRRRLKSAHCLSNPNGLASPFTQSPPRNLAPRPDPTA